MIKVLTVSIITIMAVGCATIMNGTTQDVGITTTPSGAEVAIDNVSYGMTPLIAKLSRKDNHWIRIEMHGYHRFDATLTKSTSGWVWGNIIFGGLIGLAIDAISGGLYKLSPDQVNAVLMKDDLNTDLKEDIIYIVVTLTPQSDWEKIGELARVDIPTF